MMIVGGQLDSHQRIRGVVTITHAWEVAFYARLDDDRVRSGGDDKGDYI